jgi:protein-L-isoaspartate(D-aspartate) O-methyltransferase
MDTKGRKTLKVGDFSEISRKLFPNMTSSFEDARLSMVREQIRDRDITNERVLRAMASVLRHEFVPEALRASAYDDCPLPIGLKQTISQPFCVAFMAAAIDPQVGEKVLEVGTGSGYSAAVLAEMGATVYTIEIVEPLGERAAQLLNRLGYGERVCPLIGDASNGWPEDVLFDKIMVTCAPDRVPRRLLEQLKVGGKMIIPVGVRDQHLVLLEKTEDGLRETSVLPVRFVPMTGAAARESNSDDE